MLPTAVLPDPSVYTEDYTYEYHYVDHLGNLRVAFRYDSRGYSEAMETGKGEENMQRAARGLENPSIPYPPPLV